jgi:hypothetical protein
MAFPSSIYGSMAFPRDVLLVVIAVGIPQHARQCEGIMNQSGAWGQTDLGREMRMLPIMPRRNATRAFGVTRRGCCEARQLGRQKPAQPLRAPV